MNAYDRLVASLVGICIALFIAGLFTAIVIYNAQDEHRRRVCYEQTHSTSGC